MNIVRSTNGISFIQRMSFVLCPKSFSNTIRLFTFILSSVLSPQSSLFAQVTINGNVTDAKGAAIPGANIFIKDSYDGATSDEKGNFSFTTTETGDKILAASLMGFKPFEQSIKIGTETLTVKIRLSEIVNELKAVTIAAGAFEASDEKKMVMLRPLDIVTTAGAAGDIYGAIQTLPGTGVVGEKEGLYVRGGDASETRTFIDGLPVDNPYFSSVPDVPQRGRFSPFLFKGTSFSSGGYSAQFGQAMSSALILETQDLPERSMTNLGIMSVGVSLGHTKRFKNTSVGVFGGYTDLQPYYALVNQNRDWQRAPHNATGSVIFTHKTNKNGMIKFFTSYGTSDLHIDYPDTSDPLLEQKISFQQKNQNLFSTASYKQILFKKWTLYAAGSYSRNKDDMHVDEFPVERSNDLFSSKIMLSNHLNELSVIRFGGEFQKSNIGLNVPNYESDFNEVFNSIFAEGDIYITPKIVARLGVRGEHSKAIDRNDIAPRASLAYKTGKESQVSFAYGDFYQSPDEQYVLINNSLNFERATHYILNFQKISDYRTFRIEAYYKDYDDLVRVTNSVYDNSGYGHARGIEFFYRDKKTIRMSDFWISYSYLDTKRLYGNFPVEAMPTFAANHTASLVYKYFFPKLSLAPSVTYLFATGRPYYNPNNTDYLSDRTRNYHNLSLSFSYLTSIRKSFSVVVFSVGNLLGIENVFTYNYSADGSRRMAVGPTADRFFFLGLFMNIGSQTDDADKYN
jgi:vitamin B12 transporter